MEATLRALLRTEADEHSVEWFIEHGDDEPENAGDVVTPLRRA